MSGHSKWANIRVRKGAQDAKRGKIYTRHARLIEMAAKSGPDVAMNPSLRTAVENAKADGVPNMNIERAIKKGSGELKGEQMQEMTYEAYGPGGTGFIIECLSDNRNRTTANVRSIVGMRGGRMAEGGAVSYQFERKGLVVIDVSGRDAPLGRLTPAGRLSDDEELQLIDLGAEDIDQSDDGITIVTSTSAWFKVRDFLKEKGWTIESAGLSYIAKQKVQVDAATMEKVMTLIEKLEEDDDVSEVHTNAAI